MTRIRPTYRPDDDVPFEGERWGCFGYVIIVSLGLLCVGAGKFMMTSDDYVWLPWILYLVGGLIVTYAFLRRYYSSRGRPENPPWWWWIIFWW